MKNRNLKISASALGYSIAFVLLIGLFTSGIIFISGTNKRIEVVFLGKEKMLINNQTSANYFADKSDSLVEIISHSSGDTTKLTQKKWGGYKLITAETYKKNQRVKRSFIYGIVPNEKIPNLYLAERNQKLSIGGSTRIEGWIKIPERGIQRAHISGKPFNGEKLYSGQLENSTKNLPSIKDELFQLKASTYFSLNKLDEFPIDSTFSFDSQTQLYTSESLIELNGLLHGNVIIHSLEKVVIHSNADLDNILIIAPFVDILEGFEGRVNIIAHERIDCSENVQLNYPSTLLLNEIQSNLNSQQRGIYIGSKSSVLGGIALISSEPNFRNPLFLDINDALIAGLVYCTGETQLKGKVYGSLMTSKFTLNTGGGIYGNHLLDATISSKIPSNFVYPDWLKESSPMKTQLIECL